MSNWNTTDINESEVEDSESVNEDANEIWRSLKMNEEMLLQHLLRSE